MRQTQKTNHYACDEPHLGAGWPGCPRGAVDASLASRAVETLGARGSLLRDAWSANGALDAGGALGACTDGSWASNGTCTVRKAWLTLGHHAHCGACFALFVQLLEAMHGLAHATVHSGLMCTCTGHLCKSASKRGSPVAPVTPATPWTPGLPGAPFTAAPVGPTRPTPAGPVAPTAPGGKSGMHLRASSTELADMGHDNLGQEQGNIGTSCHPAVAPALAWPIKRYLSALRVHRLMQTAIPHADT